MPEEKTVLDNKTDEALIGVAHLGLGAPPLAAVDARCRSALQHEFEREHRGQRPRVRRRIRRTLVLPLSLLLVGVFGVVGYATLSSSSTASDGIDCHLDASVDGSGTIVGLDGRSATATCAQLWADGAIGHGVSAPPAPLHACVARDGSGAIHVFASTDVGICARVGLLEDPTAGTDAASHRFGLFAAQVNEQLNSVAFMCPTPQQARQLVEGLMRASGLTGWTISDIGGYDAAHPCASLALDSNARNVTISPMVPR